MKSLKVLVLLLSVAILAGCAKNKVENKFETVNVMKGNISAFITSTGAVSPKNRLEIRPPISGRIEEVMVSEGNIVKKARHWHG